MSFSPNHGPKALLLMVPVLAMLAGCGEYSDPVGAASPGASYALAGNADGVPLCHRQGSAGYKLLNVPTGAEAAHRAHGDGAVGEVFPGVDGAAFGSNCQPYTNLTGTWEGTYTWACGAEHLTGSVPITFELTDDGTGGITGTASYLDATGGLFASYRLIIGTVMPDGEGLELTLKVEQTRPAGGTTGFVYNEFDALLDPYAPDRIVGTTLNGDTPQPDIAEDGCSHPDADAPSGAFDVTRGGT